MRSTSGGVDFMELKLAIGDPALEKPSTINKVAQHGIIKKRRKQNQEVRHTTAQEVAPTINKDRDRDYWYWDREWQKRGLQITDRDNNKDDVHFLCKKKILEGNVAMYPTSRLRASFDVICFGSGFPFRFLRNRLSRHGCSIFFRRPTHLGSRLP